MAAVIITKTPLRISFTGGGTDLPAYYEQGYGAVVSAAINKYVYITLNKRFDDTIRISYSKTEIVDSLKEIQHDIANIQVVNSQLVHYVFLLDLHKR